MQRTMKRVGALILAIAMLVTFMPSLGLTEQVHADEGSTVKVDVLTQEDENKLLKAYQEIEVSSEAAEEYGYTEPEKAMAPNEDGQISIEGKVTTLDVLVTVMKDIYGDAFTKETAQDYLAVNSGGTITKIFGGATTMTGFTVNGKNPLYVNNDSIGSLIFDTVVDDGDSLRFFRTFEDDFNMGGLFMSMLYFDGADQKSYEIKAGNKLEIAASAAYAFETMMGGPESAGTLDPEDIEISVLDNEGAVVSTVDADEDGKAEIQFVKPGEYQLVVSGYEGNGMDEHFVTPYAKVSVTLPDEVIAKISPAVRNFEKADKFDILPQEIEVSSYAAEKYEDYGDEEAGTADKVTVADLLYTLHELKFGEAFKKETVSEYLQMEGGWLKRSFGVETSNQVYIPDQNLSMSGSTYSTTLEDGSKFDYFMNRDGWNDIPVFYDLDEDLDVIAGKEFELPLKRMNWDGTSSALTKAENEDVAAALVDENGELTKVDGAVMGEDGIIKMKINKPGEYLVSATGKAVAEYAPSAAIVAPYVKVSVKLPEEKKVNVKAAVRNYAGADMFDVLPQTIEVSSHAAENYGYYGDEMEGNPDKVTVSDVVYTLHELKYGNAFDTDKASEYLVIDSGWIKKAFGVETSNQSYYVNDNLSMAGSTGTTLVEEGDKFDMYMYRDGWNDIGTVFSETDIAIDRNAEFTLNLNRVNWDGTTSALPKAAEGEVVAAIVGEDGKLEPIEGAVMGDNGVIKAKIDKAGTFLVSACGKGAGEYAASASIVAPYCMVTVKETADGAARDAQEDIKAAEALKAADYTPESYKAVQDALKALQDAIAKEGATPEEINAAKADLEKAMSELVGMKKNTMTAKAKTLKVKYAKLRKRTQKFKTAKAFTVKNPQGKVTYKVTKKAKKAKGKIVVAKNGKVTLKKGLKKGKYTVSVKITAAGKGAFKPLSKTVKLKVVVK